MRTKKQKQAATRNFQLMITGGVIANLNRMTTKTTNLSVKYKIQKVKEAIHSLQASIYKTNYEDWNE